MCTYLSGGGGEEKERKRQEEEKVCWEERDQQRVSYASYAWLHSLFYQKIDYIITPAHPHAPSTKFCSYFLTNKYFLTFYRNKTKTWDWACVSSAEPLASMSEPLSLIPSSAKEERVYQQVICTYLFVWLQKPILVQMKYNLETMSAKVTGRGEQV